MELIRTKINPVLTEISLFYHTPMLLFSNATPLWRYLIVRPTLASIIDNMPYFESIGFATIKINNFTFTGNYTESPDPCQCLITKKIELIEFW